MGNVMAKAADIVGKVVKTIKDTFREVIHKAADVVMETVHNIKHAIADVAGNAIKEVIRFSVNQPHTFKIMAWASAGTLGCLALAPIFLSVILPVVGFTGGGVAAGSLAAAWQAMIGNVAAGSVFSILTSAGAGGFGVGMVVAAHAAVGPVVGTTMGALSEGLNGLPRGPRPGNPAPTPAIEGPEYSD